MIVRSVRIVRTHGEGERVGRTSWHRVTTTAMIHHLNLLSKCSWDCYWWNLLMFSRCKWLSGHLLMEYWHIVDGIFVDVDYHWWLLMVVEYVHLSMFIPATSIVGEALLLLFCSAFVLKPNPKVVVEAGNCIAVVSRCFQHSCFPLGNPIINPWLRYVHFPATSLSMGLRKVAWIEICLPPGEDKKSHCGWSTCQTKIITQTHAGRAGHEDSC